MAEEKTRIDELTEQWRARGLKYDDAAEFINLLLKERSGVTITCIDEFARTGDTKPAATGSLDHLEILMERQADVLYKLLTNSGRREDLLREMLESLGRIEEALIVAKPPSWKECDHEWVETTGGKRCNKCGVCIVSLT